MTKAEQGVRSYPTDLTDSEWAILAPLVDTPRIGAGRPRTVDLRAVMNGLRYWLRTGCQWAMIPHDFPPSGTVRYYYDKWTKTGLWEQINTVLRESVRVQLGREAQPSAGVIDSQSVKTTEAGGERGFDGENKITGRKRHITVDTEGFLLKALVHPTDMSEKEGEMALLRGRLEIIES